MAGKGGGGRERDWSLTWPRGETAIYAAVTTIPQNRRLSLSNSFVLCGWESALPCTCGNARCRDRRRFGKGSPVG